NEWPGPVEHLVKAALAFEGGAVARPFAEVEGRLHRLDAGLLSERHVQQRRWKDPVHPAAQREVRTVVGGEIDDRGVAIVLGALQHLAPATRGPHSGGIGLSGCTVL